MRLTAMLTTVPSSSALPDPRVTVARVRRPWAERRASSCSAMRCADLLLEHLRSVHARARAEQPGLDLVALGVAHQPDDVAGLGAVEQRLEGGQLGRVRRYVVHTHPG